MNIALDFDGTYTEDYQFWDRVISDGQKRGHNIFLVTFRSPEHEALSQSLFDRLKKMKVPLIFTDRVPKRKFTESMGLRIDVWIDDNPDLIIQESAWSKEDYETWTKKEAARLDELAKEAKKKKEKQAKVEKESKEQIIARWTQVYMESGQNQNVAQALAHHRWASESMSTATNNLDQFTFAASPQWTIHDNFYPATPTPTNQEDTDGGL